MKSIGTYILQNSKNKSLISKTCIIITKKTSPKCLFNQNGIQSPYPDEQCDKLLEKKRVLKIRILSCGVKNEFHSSDLKELRTVNKLQANPLF